MTGIANNRFPGYGRLVRTDSDGPSSVSDYNGAPVYDSSGRQYPAGATIPPGAQISVGFPAAGTGGGGQAEMGTQIPLDAETIRHTQQVDAQAAANASNSYNLGMAQLGQSATSSQNAYNTAKAQFDLDGMKAQQQYQMDVARFGLEQANANYQQRLGDATVKLQLAAFGQQGDQFELSQNQFNSQQRNALADRKYQITKDLADRTGPQDQIAYQRLLNGLDAPTADRRGIIDPFSGLSDLYQESHIQRTAAPTIGPLAQPISITPPAAPTMPSFPGYVAPTASLPAFVPPSGTLGASGGSSTGSSGGGGTSTTPGPSPAPVAPAARPQGPIPTEAGAAGTTTAPGGRRPVTLDPNVAPDASGYRWDSANSEWVDPANGNQPWHAFLGGSFKGGQSTGPVVVGDQASGKPTGDEEIAYASIDPKTGGARLDVIPHHEIAGHLNKLLGRKEGQVHNIKKLPKELQAMLPRGRGIPRAAEGGEFYGGNDQWGGNTPGLTVQPIDPGKYMTQGAGAGLGGPTGIQTPGPVSAPNPGGGSGYPINVGPAGPVSAPGTMVNSAAQPAGGNLGQSVAAGASAAPVAPAPTGTPAAGGVTTQYAQDPNAPGEYGSDLNDPVYRVNTYSPATMGSQPYINKLLGRTPGRLYGGFGAKISDPQLGIQDFNPMFNLRNYNEMGDSEQKSTQELFNRGLSLNWQDFLGQAERAAPIDNTYRRIAASAYGG